jgi:RHS repeat-associated protein
MYSDGAYAPFGEPYAQTGTTDLSFTGMNQDTVSGLYDFSACEYSIQGRWPSPDPMGIGAATLDDPQTLNQFAYVANRPLTSVDPLGTKICLNAVCEGDRAGGGGGIGGDFIAGADFGGDLGMPDDSFGSSFPLFDGGYGQFSMGMGVSNPVSAIMGALILGWGSVDSLLVSDNFHSDENGNAIGDFPGEKLCLQPSPFGCREMSAWNPQTGSWDAPCDNPPCISDWAHDTLGTTGTLADAELKSAVLNMVIGDLGAAAGALAPELLAGEEALSNLPPGWNSDWELMGSSRGQGLRWFDESGGEWRWHGPDQFHVGHWDYNPNTQWNSPWTNIPK